MWFGFPLADSIIGLVIAAMMFGIVWQSATAVFTRLLDGVDPRITAELGHTAEHVPGIARLQDARARWVGHRLRAEADIVIDAELPVREAAMLAERLRAEAQRHLPALSALRVEIKATPARAGASRNIARATCGGPRSDGLGPRAGA